MSFRNNTNYSPLTQRSTKCRIGPAGIHFFDRESGANILFDEVRAPPEQWASGPRYVSVALTNVCDLSCHFCYAPKNAAYLQNDRLVQWLTEFDQNGSLGVGFGGGEPTLYPKFVQLCRHITENTTLSVTFTTHAHHVCESLAADLRGNVNFIRVSMDGIGHTYEMLRGRRFSSFLRYIEIVRSISSFGINYVVNAQTFLDLEAALVIAKDIGAIEFLLLPEQAVNGYGGIDCQTAMSLRELVCSYRGSVPLRVSEAGAAGLPTCDPLQRETGLRAYVHIDASGIMKYSSFHNSGVEIGTDSAMSALKALEMSSGNRQ